MTPESFENTLVTLRRSVPFRPFTVELTDGTALRVDDAQALACRGGTAVFVDHRGVPIIFDHQRVARITPQANGADARHAECGRRPEDPIPDGTIYDRGRGPEIKGTRITVFAVMDYYRKGWSYDQIAGLYRLPPDWIQAAIRYIEEHREEVEREYQKMLDRHRNYEYPPEVKEKLARSREKFKEFVAKVRARQSAQPETDADDGRDE